MAIYSEANLKKMEIIAKAEVNSTQRQIPSVGTFEDAAKNYREKFGPKMHRFSTRDIALGHIRNHLGYFNEFPVNKEVDELGAHRKQQYATYALLDAAAAGRVSEILALRGKDIDFKASTNSDRRGFRPTEQGACGTAQEHRGSANSRAQGRSGTTCDEGTEKVCREITRSRQADLSVRSR
jgi:integrase